MLKKSVIEEPDTPIFAQMKRKKMDNNITKMRYSEYSPFKMGNVLLGTKFENVIHEELLWNQNNEVPLAAQPAERLPSTNEFSSSHHKLNIRWHTSVSLAVRRWR